MDANVQGAAAAAMENLNKAVANANKEPSVWDDCKSTVRTGLMAGVSIGIAVGIVTAVVIGTGYIPRNTTV